MNRIERELNDRLRALGRLPAFYRYDLDGWLECVGCHVSVRATTGEVPDHCEPCRVAEIEWRMRRRVPHAQTT